MSTVVKAHGKSWLFRIAPADWKPSSDERVAVIGPLVLPPGTKEYAARYMVDVAPIVPGGHTTPVHHHPGHGGLVCLGGRAMLAGAGEDSCRPCGRIGAHAAWTTDDVVPERQ